MKSLMFVFFTMCFASVSFQAQATNTFTFTDALKIVSDTTALVEYKGKYVFGDGVTIKDVTIVIEKEGLFAKSAEGDFNLKPIKGKADSFTVEEISAEITFTRDNNKKITGLSLTMSEGTVPAKKEAAQ
jgi:lipopolysaccharide export system protein LptA